MIANTNPMFSLKNFFINKTLQVCTLEGIKNKISPTPALSGSGTKVEHDLMFLSAEFAQLPETIMLLRERKNENYLFPFLSFRS